MNKGSKESSSDFSPRRKAVWEGMLSATVFPGKIFLVLSTEEVLKILDLKGVSRTAVGREATVRAKESWE